MNSRRIVVVVAWVSSFAVLAGIVLVYRRWLHVNPTTVALTLVLYVLLVAARLSLRYAVAVSIAATCLYNYYFLPPINTFTISDPQNWLALFAFLATSVVGSRLSQKARDEAAEARARQAELEVLFSLSRELLQTQNVAELINAVPMLINAAAKGQSSALYLLDGDRLYQTGHPWISGVEIPHLRQMALSLPAPELSPPGEAYVPLRAGVKPRGLLRLVGSRLSAETLQAIGGLASIALDRAQALEDVARSEANKESERIRSLILDSITHELRTPLTSIKGATGTLLQVENLNPEDRRELLTIIEEESDRLNKLVGQAVEMAQIESQEVHMTFAPVALGDLLAEAQESCSFDEAAHPLTVSLPDHLPMVRADKTMLVKVLCNLLENAAKYSDTGAPVFFSAETRNGCVVASVADRGMGIDAAEQGLIFERLYRSRQSAEGKPGTGMGLAISKAIMESHDGSLTVTSQSGHGSVFSFSLPVADAR